MKIVKLKKKNNNQYLLITLNDEICLYDDTILKYDLLLKKELDESRLEEILSYNKKLDEYYNVIKKLKRKRMTEYEVVEYFKKLNIEKKIYDDFISKLKNARLIDDISYLQAYVHDHVYLKMEGPRKIQTDLLKLGFLDKDIKRVLNSIDPDDYVLNINKIINKKIKANHKDSGKVLELKIATYIVHMGYTKELTMQQISKYTFSNLDILKKEYQNLKKRLEKKYSGSDLEYKIKQKLYSRGFKEEEIEQIKGD